MKKTYMTKAFVGIFSAFLFATGCEDMLDIEPVNNVDLSSAYGSPGAMNASTVGLYTGLYNFGTYSNDYIMVADLLAADSIFNFRGTFSNFFEPLRAQMTIEGTNPLRIWQNSYTLIMRSNLLLANLENAAPGDRDRIRGEAKFMRGTVYFNLVRFFSPQYTMANANTPNKGVPVYTEPIPLDDPLQIPTQFNRPRNTIEETYRQAINDLVDAFNVLPVQNDADPVNPVTSRANQVMAAAMLARVYLQKGQLDSAGFYADAALAERSTVLPDPRTVFAGEATDEAIWELQQNQQNGAVTVNGGLAAHYGTSSPYRGDVVIARIVNDTLRPTAGARLFPVSTAFWDTPDDPRNPDPSRGVMGSFGFDANDFVQLFIYKWSGDPLNAGDNWISNRKAMALIRVPEMYLIRAEARLAAGDAAGAASDINAVRTPRGVSAITAGTVTREFIYRERTRELYGEGQYLFDKKRLNKNIRVYTGNNPGSFPATADRFVLPIPRRAIQTNPQLVQNDGY